MTTYSFISTDAARPEAHKAVEFDLTMRQQPDRARVCTVKERERRPLDPPPIIQLKIRADDALAQNYLQNPYLFMCANLMDAQDDCVSSVPASDALAGTIVSSLYRLKDVDNSEGGFFIFGDISVKVEGVFRMKFSLFDVVPRANGEPSLEVVHVKSIVSQPFTVYSAKEFPGMSQSTFLSRSFSDQGVRIRIRKEHRMQMKPCRLQELDTRGQSIREISDTTYDPRRNTSAVALSTGAPAADSHMGQHRQHDDHIQSSGASHHVTRTEHRPVQYYHPYAQHGHPNSSHASSTHSLPSMYTQQSQWSPRQTQGSFDAASSDAGNSVRRLSGGTSTNADQRLGHHASASNSTGQYGPPQISRRLSSGAQNSPTFYTSSRKNSNGSTSSAGGLHTPMHPPNCTSYFPGAATYHLGSSPTAAQDFHGMASGREQLSRSFDSYQVHYSPIFPARRGSDGRISPKEPVHANDNFLSRATIPRLTYALQASDKESLALRSIPPPHNLLSRQGDYPGLDRNSMGVDLDLKLPPLQLAGSKENDGDVYDAPSAHAFNPYATAIRSHSFARYS